MRRIPLLAGLAALLAVTTAVPAEAAVSAVGVITTIAGDGYPGPEYRPAVTAQLNSPDDVAADGSGNYYVIDSENHRIRRISSTGTITTVAGNGTTGEDGDGGPATSAGIGSPGGLDVDSLGNLYFVARQRVRKVTPSGIITTVAGTATQTCGFSGDGGPATSAQLCWPTDVAVDGFGNLYIADSTNERIRRVTDGVITTVAGTGTHGYNGDDQPATSAFLAYPSNIAVDGAGNIYVSDSDNLRVRRIGTSGYISTFAGTGVSGNSGDGGPATSARIQPFQVSVDTAGNVYAADLYRIRKIGTDGIIRTFAGSGTGGYSGDGGPATAARFGVIQGIAAKGPGGVYVSDPDNQRVRKVDAGGIVTTVAGTGVAGHNFENVPATTAALDQPRHAIKDGRTGNLYIADYNHHRVVKVTPDGILTTVAGNGGSGFSGDGGPATSAEVASPVALAIDSAGNLYIAQIGHRIRKVDTSGVIRTYAGTGQKGYAGDGGPATQAVLYAPNDVALDAAGNLYIADSANNRIRRIDTDGVITTVAGSGAAGYGGDGGQAKAAALNFPTGVDLDAAGNVYIADYLNHRIREVATNGVITTIAGTGTAGYSGDGGPAKAAQVNTPHDVAVDNSGNVYLSDSDQPRIRKIRTDGTILTVAGTGTNGFSGDSGYATAANIGKPSGIDVDSAGNLYLSFEQHRVRKVAFTG